MRNSMKLSGMVLSGAALVAVGAALSGCGGGPAAGQAPPPVASKTQTNLTSKAGTAVLEPMTGVPGTPIAQSGDPNRVKTLVASRSFDARTDPFALFPVEVQFDRLQRTEWLVGATGGFSMQYEAPPEVIEEDLLEPQPYRRLAGVLIGETVSAIIIMEDGKSYIVKPGMRIPNSEWTVVMIDGEKAVLRREGSRRPNEVTVRLETPPAGLGGNQPRGGTPRGGGPGEGGGLIGPGGG